MSDPSGDADYDPSRDPPGIGRELTLIVLGVLVVVAFMAAWSLHAFPWQAPP